MSRTWRCCVGLALLLITGLLPAVDEVPVDYAGCRVVSARVLAAAARRDLAEWQREREPSYLADAAWAMQAALRREGFARAQVAVTTTGAEATQRVLVSVAEGARCRLGKLRFAGNTAVSSHDLLRLHRPRGLGLLALGDPPLRLSDLAELTGDIAATYRTLGYHQVAVAAPVLTWRADQRTADAVVTVREGPRFTVAAVSASAADPAVVTVAEGLLADLVGGPWRPDTATVASARLRGHWLALGYQSIAVTVRTVPQGHQPLVLLEVSIAPGQPYLLRHIVVTGTRSTAPSFVAARFALQPGDLLAKGPLDEGVRDLLGSGLFRAVTVSPASVADVAGGREADLDVVVQEGRPRRLDLEVGFGSYEGPRVGARLTERNLLGVGRSAELAMGASAKDLFANLLLRDRWLLGGADTLELGGGAEWREEPTFDRTTFDPTASWRHQFAKALSAWSSRVGYTYETSRATNVRGEIPDAERNGFTSSARLFARLRRDNRDNPVLPNRGSLLEIGVARSAPWLGSDLDFAELVLTGAGFIPLNVDEDMVLGLNLEARTRPVLGDSDSLPVAERFFLGGAEDVRSFTEDALGPRGADGSPTGGLTSVNATIELRARLRAALHGACFYDWGVVSPKAFDIGHDRGQALGVGLRYQLPVGPIRLDLAWNPDYAVTSDRALVWNLTVGFSF